MTDPKDDEDLKILQMVADWTRQTAEMADHRLQQVRQAIAEEDGSAADRLENPQHPPCPLCGAEVTSFEFNSEGPVLIEFQPCGSKVVREGRRGRTTGVAIVVPTGNNDPCDSPHPARRRPPRWRWSRHRR